jgi:hypothetical protein
MLRGREWRDIDLTVTAHTANRPLLASIFLSPLAFLLFTKCVEEAFSEVPDNITAASSQRLVLAWAK